MPYPFPRQGETTLVAKSTLLAEAHRLAEKYRWSIVPTVKKGASCKWARFQTSAPGRKQRGGRFGSNEDIDGLAVVAGAVSDRLRVRDFDQADAYDRWAAAHAELAAGLPTSRTGRGYHVFFRADLPDRVTAFGDGELRAGGGIVVLPPSCHPAGGRYAWTQPPGDAIPFLGQAALQASGLPGVVPAAPPGAPAGVPEAVRQAILRTTPTGAGQRHRAIFAFARVVKGLEPEAGFETLQGYLAAWYAAAEPFIATKDYAA